MASKDAHLVPIYVYVEVNDLAYTTARIKDGFDCLFTSFFILKSMCLLLNFPQSCPRNENFPKRKRSYTSFIYIKEKSKRNFILKNLPLPFRLFSSFPLYFFQQMNRSDHEIFVWLMFSSQYPTPKNAVERFILIENHEWISPTKKNSHFTCQHINEISTQENRDGAAEEREK